MIHFAYKENGDYEGIYIDSIHEEIPEKSIEITEELWQELLKDNYRFKTNVLAVARTLDLVDKDTYFEKAIIEVPNIPVQANTQEILTQQLTGLIVENKKKDMAIAGLAKTVAELNIKISKMGGTR